MTDYEKKTDFIVAQLLTNAGLDFTMNGEQILKKVKSFENFRLKKSPIIIIPRS